MPPTRQTVASVVIEHPQCADVFRRHRIDFCCRGEATIEDAAAERGLDAGALVEELERVIDEWRDDGQVDPRGLTTAALIDRIVSRHHAYLRSALPRIRGLATKVAKVHGDHEPALRALDETVELLASMLLSHIEDEESALFPVLVAADVDQLAAARLLDEMAGEHIAVAGLLERIRTTTGDFSLPDWACGSYRVLFSELRQLEADIFTHVHLENHVLKPRFATSPAGSPTNTA